jgi:succinate dehydrogenase hydrophobic anchor subunit
MQTDLHDFLARIATTVAMTLLTVAFIAFVTLPASLHHHIGTPAPGVDIAPQHMT